MAVTIRLKRMGRTNSPFYRVVAADNRYATDGRFLEILGWYDPNKPGTNFKLKMDRVEEWISNGAEVSDTAKSLVKKGRLLQASAPAAEAVPAAEEAPAEASSEG